MDNLSTPQRPVRILTPEQRDGHACAACGASFVRETVASVPVGDGLFACEPCAAAADQIGEIVKQTFAAAANRPRPYWQTKPCPSWCVEDTHDDMDPPSARTHWSAFWATSLTSMPPLEFSGEQWGAHDLSVSLEQGELDAEPRVILSENTDKVVLHLTLAEADKVMADLAALLRIARGGRPGE